MEFAIKDLRATRPREIRHVMDEEGSMWRRKLRWDYSSTHQFISNYMRMSLLPGLVLLKDEQPVGYAYMITDGSRGVFGNVYVLEEHWGAGGEERLAEGMIRACQNSGDITRIEAQMLIFSGAPLEQLFRRYGFDVYERNYLSLPLEQWQGLRPAPEGYTLITWRDTLMQEAADLVFESYRGGVDAQFATSFATREPCREFVQNLVRRSGCGDFLSRMTTAAIDSDGNLAGVVLATRLDAGSGHLPQISVHPRHHGNGIGTWLVYESLNRYKKEKYSTVSLTVTKRNEKADAWYRRIGFQQVLRFNAYLWMKAGGA